MNLFNWLKRHWACRTAGPHCCDGWPNEIFPCPGGFTKPVKEIKPHINNQRVLQLDPETIKKLESGKWIMSPTYYEIKGNIVTIKKHRRLKREK